MLKGLFEKILDLIYKKKCIVCSCAKTNELLCKTCAKDVNYLSHFPHRIYNSTPIYSAALYKSTVKKLIQTLKFQHKKSSSIVLAKILSEYYKRLNLNKNCIVIYPNSFYLKKLYRSYDHMYLIAKNFCRMINLDLCKNSIQKTRNTIPQYQAKDRFKNIKNSFKINKKCIKILQNRPVLLIDDIITSGATIEEIISILKEENINNITVLTISKSEK